MATAGGGGARTALATRLRGRFHDWARGRQRGALPVRFDRHGIYILPTPFGWFFLVLLLARGVGALNYNNNPALLLGLLLAGAANTSLFSAHLQTERAGSDRHRRRTRAGRHAAEPASVHVRAAPGRERRGAGAVRRQLSGSLAGQTAPAKPPGDATQTAGWLEPSGCASRTTRPLGLARAWAYAWPELPYC